ncbi:MAG: VOC family protein, partial [Caulobacteraceae bacterium]|nr:VOC family protein [Caulobacteraceae bacterium]
MRQDGKIDYVELPGGNLPGAKAFYTAAFGWTYAA